MRRPSPPASWRRRNCGGPRAPWPAQWTRPSRRCDMNLSVQDSKASPASAQLRGRRFAYLGPEGTFTEQALRRVPEAMGGRLLPAASASEALAHVRRGTADAAMLPVQNTVAGMVPDTLRALVEQPSPAVLREVVLGVEFAVLVRPGASLRDIRTVSGHSHAGAQVRRWLREHVPRAHWVTAPSNAAAARSVREGECDAAVAGEFTAARYGLEAIATGIQDTPGATTRFLLCARSGTLRGTGSHPADRTSLIGRFAGRPEQQRDLLDGLKNHPFLQAASLNVADHGPGGHILLADCPGPPDHPDSARAVGLLQLRLPGLRSLGSYASLCPVVVPYERSRTVPARIRAVDGASAEPALGDISRLREQIDALDHLLIDTLRKRLEASREIQRLRTGHGGSPVDSGRERTVRGRFAESLGEGGGGIADAVLELCRGKAAT
ncbi:prephenate dehydratase domain-containing protein [Streptomyces sp. LHD-70]|uniref:prephenate dehydratase domain-containing protein n=1 Tax=Streptomyces sp. LHD-70 TaxID=3072140 RepID=UPI002810383A|nr:prephenate dehydratase domain-containing protein [Streptomyces sp. LHD-70]MDQ8708123.1 prephenate dehydratase domain-containing protein [Streptomyces sp. LHD-70]